MMLGTQSQTLERSLTGRPPIPAMTTDAERECYYRLAKEAAVKGTIIELGAWLGASTAYIAAGIRDSGVKRKALVFDHFKSKPGHIQKVKAFYDEHGLDRAPVGPCLEEFKNNLGPLMEFVDPRQGQIETEIAQPWAENSVSLLVNDAAKRVPALSAVLTALRNALQSGAVLVFQDFCHFPSYEIPACLYRIRDHLEFVEAIVPGTTLVFRIKSQWSADEVSLDALALGRWTPDEIADAWDYLLGKIHPAKREVFKCGRAMFLCDIGRPAEAVEVLRQVIATKDQAALKKWRYLHERRADFLTRYAPLFEHLKSQGVL